MCIGTSEGASGYAALRRAAPPHGPSPWLGSGPRHMRTIRYEKCHDERGLWRFYVSGPCLVVGDSVGSRLPSMGNSKHLLVVGSFHGAPQRPFLSLIEREESGSRLFSAGLPHGTSHNGAYVHRRLGRRLGLRGAAARRSATQPLGPVCYVARPMAGAKCSRCSRDGAEQMAKPRGAATAGAGWGVFHMR